MKYEEECRHVPYQPNIENNSRQGPTHSLGAPNGLGV